MRLKNTADNFSASFHITLPYQMMVIHSSKLIYPRELYQRGIQRKRVELIAKDFNEYQQAQTRTLRTAHQRTGSCRSADRL